MTGCWRACAATTFALMCSNWASRSGGCDPSSAVRLDWRENPSFANSAPTRIGADRMSHLGQRRRELRHAFRHPDQGPDGIAPGRRFDQPLERSDQLRVGFRHRPTPAAGAANPPLRKRLAVEVVFAAIDRRTRAPANLRDQRETAATGAPRLRRRKQPPTTLVKPRADRLPFAAESPPRRSCDRTTPLRRTQESPTPESS